MLNNLKAFISFLVIIICFCISLNISFADQRDIEVVISKINVEVDNQTVQVSNILYNDVTYVPLRFAAEKLHKYISWNSQTGTVNVTNKILAQGEEGPSYLLNSPNLIQEEKIISVNMNSLNIQVNSIKVNSDNFIYNDATYVPLRTIVEMFKKVVKWDETTSTASIVEDENISFSSHTDLLEYLESEFSTLKTELGNFNFNICVQNLDISHFPQDYTIITDIQPSMENIVKILRDSKVSNRQKASIRKALKDHQTKIADTVIKGMPGKKFKGYYYTHVNSWSGFNMRSSFTIDGSSDFYYIWTNYDVASVSDQNKIYEDTLLSSFRWIITKKRLALIEEFDSSDPIQTIIKK